MKKVIVIFTVLFMFLGITHTHSAWSADELRFFSWAKKHIRENFSLRLHAVVVDIAKNHTTVIYFGPDLSFNIGKNILNLSAMLGKVFVEEDHMKVAFLASYNTKRWSFCSQLDYNINKENFWHFVQVKYTVLEKLGFWVGGEMENTYRGDDWSTTIGPSIGVKINKVVSIYMTFFNKWTADGNSGFLRANLNLNLDNV